MLRCTWNRPALRQPASVERRNHRHAKDEGTRPWSTKPSVRPRAVLPGATSSSITSVSSGFVGASAFTHPVSASANPSARSMLPPARRAPGVGPVIPSRRDRRSIPGYCARPSEAPWPNCLPPDRSSRDGLHPRRSRCAGMTCSSRAPPCASPRWRSRRPTSRPASVRSTSAWASSRVGWKRSRASPSAACGSPAPPTSTAQPTRRPRPWPKPASRPPRCRPW